MDNVIAKVINVRKALQKMHGQNAIGTVDLVRCIAYLEGVEAELQAHQEAIDRFKAHVLDMD